VRPHNAAPDRRGENRETCQRGTRSEVEITMVMRIFS